MSLATKVFLMALAAALVVNFSAESAAVKRSEDAAKNVTEPPCLGRTPCGWAVYNKMDRVIEYFLDNKCSCVDGKKCLRDGDDLSIAAYVYRCVLPIT
ncbi:uncharacterized protein [Leptinotarsa decemlineata]|uniref:uncharacterized protein n=1 Tax=Leptinotarsa decemlineata TaxID=7539 RepID=UPI003D3055E2